MWYFLPFIAIENIQILKINLPVQTLYLFQILIPFILMHFMLIEERGIHHTPIFKLLVFFVFYTTFITLIYTSFTLCKFINLSSLLRQTASLLVGFLSFIALRYIFLVSTDEQILKGMLIGFFLILAFSIADLFSGRARIYSTFTEPSHLAYDLVLVYLFVFLIYRDSLTKTKYTFLLASWLLIFLFTFSGSGYIALVFFALILLVYYLVSVKDKRLITYTLIFICLLGLVYFFLFKFEKSHAFRVTKAFLENLFINPYTIPISVMDRLQAFIFLFNLKLETIEDIIHLLFGTGLGSDIRLKILLPPIIFEQIRAVKMFESYLTSFFSKIVIYSGIFGMLWFALYIFVLFKTSKKLINEDLLPKYYTQSLIFTLAFVALYTLGPFSSIGLWFIPAFIDAKYIKYLTTQK